MSDKIEKKTVKICGWKQNCCILRNNTNSLVSPTEANKTRKKYEILEKQMLQNGYIEQINEKDYPINSDSVSSLAEGADYKNDPLQAIANAPVRVNLGDITQAQEFLKNPQNFARVYEQTKQRLAEYYARQREVNGKTESPTTQKTESPTTQNGGNQ